MMIDTMVKEFTIQTNVKVHRDMAWDVLNDHRHIAQWWGPDGFVNPFCVWEARTGGKLFIGMKSLDGTLIQVEGEFIEVTRPEILAFTTAKLDHEGLRTLEFQHVFTLEGNCQETCVRLHSRAMEASGEISSMMEIIETGWRQSFVRYEKYIRSHHLKTRRKRCAN